MNATLLKIKARKGCFCSDSIEEPYFLASQETFSEQTLNESCLRTFKKFKSNQIKSLLLSHHHSTSALVSEILTSVLQTVQKKQQLTYGQYLFTDCTEDNVQNTHTYTQYT